MNAAMHSVPGINVPPPVIYVSAFLIGIGLNILWLTSPMPTFWAFTIGTALRYCKYTDDAACPGAFLPGRNAL